MATPPMIVTTQSIATRHRRARPPVSLSIRFLIPETRPREPPGSAGTPPPVRRRGRTAAPSSSSPGGALPALLTPPVRDTAVIAREQHVGNGPAPELRRPGVVRILEAAFEAGRERLLVARSLAQRSREPPRDRIDHDHRRQLPSRENIRPDRDRVG